MKITNDIKNCLHCDKPIKGRSDKKFCNDFCRNNHYNRLNATDNNYIRNINNQLRKNRRILSDLLQEKEVVQTKKEELIHLGFRFHFATYVHTNNNGTLSFFCYEYGYTVAPNDKILIVKKGFEDHDFQSRHHQAPSLDKY